MYCMIAGNGSYIKSWSFARHLPNPQRSKIIPQFRDLPRPM